MEAGDTSGVSYGALTLSLSHGARERMLHLIWDKCVERLPRPVGEGRGEGTIRPRGEGTLQGDSLPADTPRCTAVHGKN